MPADLAAVRKTLKGAGLAPAKRNVSSNVRKTHGMGGNYATITAAGFALKNETEYRRKKHERTGRVLVDILSSSWHPDADQAEAMLTTATAALEAAGYGVQRADVPDQIIVTERQAA